VCVLGKKFEPVAIGRLERFAADYARTYGNIPPAELPEPTGKKVAVIGAGPAGITVAGDLARLGHKVVIYEALHLPGGVLMYGIPEFRLPKHIVQYEINNLKKLNVELHTDYVIGKTETVDQLIADQGFDAVFIGAGAGLPMFLDIPGENAIGVYSANEFLTRINLMKAYDFPHYATSPIRAKHVITVGGGNVAMDSARCALRLGAKSTVVYRRAREQMPARIEEIHHAEEEGVVFNFLTNPVRIITDDRKRAVGMECLRMKLGEPDDSGRRRPVAIEGSNFTIEADVVVVAIGNKPNPLIPQTSPELKITRWGTIAVDEKTMATDREGVFAGGDIVSGAATVISAMGQGKIAAKSIDYYLRTGQLPQPQPEPKGEDQQQPAELQETISGGQRAAGT
jgi:glutamate synthase (NADPH/NADH) small chain